MKLGRGIIIGVLGLMFSLLSSPAAKASSDPTAVIQPGEGLSQFSLRVLGTSKRWKEIFQLNSDRIVNANLVFAGTVLRLPVESGRTIASVPVAQPLDSGLNSARSERIQSGESLSQFSLRVLGTCKLWPKVYAWNRDRVTSPDRVLAGTLLRLGPSPERQVAEAVTKDKAISFPAILPENVPSSPEAAAKQELKPYQKMELPF